jgi:hypothetical protein
MTDERRGEKRIPVEMWVEEFRGEEIYYQRSGNVSAGGLFLDGTIPHPRGTIVQLRFTLPGEAEAIDLRGEIVGDPDEERLGMHVKFLGLEAEPAIAGRLRGFVARADTGGGA